LQRPFFVCHHEGASAPEGSAFCALHLRLRASLRQIGTGEACNDNAALKRGSTTVALPLPRDLACSRDAANDLRKATLHATAPAQSTHTNTHKHTQVNSESADLAERRLSAASWLPFFLSSRAQPASGGAEGSAFCALRLRLRASLRQIGTGEGCNDNAALKRGSTTEGSPLPRDLACFRDATDDLGRPHSMRQPPPSQRTSR